MGKYAPLKSFLIEQGREHVPMTFAQIEKLLNLRLPASKRYPAWWSNNPTNNTMTREWLAAGYETESVDVESEKLVFRRAKSPLASRVRQDAGAGGSARPARHPGFGLMKGLTTITSGTDLTAPTGGEWGSSE